MAVCSVEPSWTLFAPTASKGHSGMSHGYTLALFNKVVNFKMLTPLTDDPVEWMDLTGESGGDPTFQNTRQSSCFSKDGGKTYYDLDDPANVASVEDGWKTNKPFAEWKFYTSTPRDRAGKEDVPCQTTA